MVTKTRAEKIAAHKTKMKGAAKRSDVAKTDELTTRAELPDKTIGDAAGAKTRAEKIAAHKAKMKGEPV